MLRSQSENCQARKAGGAGSQPQNNKSSEHISKTFRHGVMFREKLHIHFIEPIEMVVLWSRTIGTIVPLTQPISNITLNMDNLKRTGPYWAGAYTHRAIVQGIFSSRCNTFLFQSETGVHIMPPG